MSSVLINSECSSVVSHLFNFLKESISYKAGINEVNNYSTPLYGGCRLCHDDLYICKQPFKDCQLLYKSLERLGNSPFYLKRKQIHTSNNIERRDVIVSFFAYRT